MVGNASHNKNMQERSTKVTTEFERSLVVGFNAGWVASLVRETIAKPVSNSRGWRNDTNIDINVGHEAFDRITLMGDKQVASIGITRRRRHLVSPYIQQCYKVSI